MAANDSIPAFTPVVVSVLEASSGIILGHVTGEPGAKLGKLAFQAFTEAVNATSHIPSRLEIETTIPLGKLSLLMNRHGIRVEMTDNLPAAREMLQALQDGFGKVAFDDTM